MQDLFPYKGGFFMKKKLFIAVGGVILAISTATGAMAAASSSSSRGAYPHYHGFKYCTASSCAPTKPARPQTTSSPVTKPQATTAPQEKPEATTTPSQTQAPSQSESSLGRRMLDMVNDDRADNGLSSLAWSSELAEAALEHSRDMAQNNYFSHTSPTYGGFSVRLKASGISTLGAGENLALYNSLEKAQAALMSSSGHRANILKANYTHCGIGIVYSSSKGAYYITQWFAKMK